MALFVALAGNIGVGKTTAAQIIADHFEFRTLHEPVVDNRFLSMYYSDMTRWSFTLQMEFLLRRVEHHREVALEEGGYIQDRSLLEDPEIFAKYLHGLGHMTDSELDLYFDFCRMLMPTIHQPDRIILLTCPNVNTLLRRIADRGRQAESRIGARFLKGLEAYYSTFAEVCEKKYKIPTLSIDVTGLDIRTSEGQSKFLTQIEEFLAKDYNTNRDENGTNPLRLF